MFKPDAIPQKRFVIFQDIRRILRKNPMERTDDQIDDLVYYFRNNEFFKKYGEENGESNLRMIYKVMKFQVRLTFQHLGSWSRQICHEIWRNRHQILYYFKRTGQCKNSFYCREGIFIQINY